jgi:hypothetical protein
MTYTEWIETYQGQVYGMCASLTQQMIEAFPELKRVRGHYLDPVWGRREHWWCVAPDGSIVDPTKSQFPSKGMGPYKEHVEGTPEPTGKCHNCGDYCYNGHSFCSLECEKDTMMDMGFTHKTQDGAWAR